MRYLAVEGGGTTWRVAIALDEPNHIIKQQIFDTDPNPIITLTAIKQWMTENKPFDSIGIASFGPIDANPKSQTYGFITSTPKPGWKNTNVIALLGVMDIFKDIPFLFDTDVNAPAMAEYQLYMAPKGLSSTAYITVGTGVGVGLVINGKTVHGLLHPEAGHLQVKLKSNDVFPGTCPYHGACIEGMCSTGALSSRLGILPEELPNLSDEHPLWDDCAYYIAQLCANLVLTVSPERIHIGGGVLKRSILYEKIRFETKRILNGYIQHNYLLLENGMSEYIGPSTWGSDAGIVGAAYLAKIALNSTHG